MLMSEKNYQFFKMYAEDIFMSISNLSSIFLNISS